MVKTSLRESGCMALIAQGSETPLVILRGTEPGPVSTSVDLHSDTLRRVSASSRAFLLQPSEPLSVIVSISRRIICNLALTRF